jgi:hypothetical protein
LRIYVAYLGILIGALGLGIDAWSIFPSMMVVSDTNPVARSFPDVFIYFWTFFTHLTNLGLVLIYVAEVAGWRWLSWLRTAAARAIAAG